MEEGGVRVRGQGGRQLLAEVGAGRLQPLSSAAAKAKVAADEVVLAEAAAATADCWNPGSWPRKQTSWSAAAEGLAAGVVVTEAGGQRRGPSQSCRAVGRGGWARCAACCQGFAASDD